MEKCTIRRLFYIVFSIAKPGHCRARACRKLVQSHATPYWEAVPLHICDVTIDILLEGEHILVVESDGDFILSWNLKFNCSGHQLSKFYVYMCSWLAYFLV